MTDLSPQAQAVLDAVEDDCIHPTDLHRIAAAALRAAAEQIVLPKYQYADWEMANLIMQEIQAVADELDQLT